MVMKLSKTDRGTKYALLQVFQSDDPYVYAGAPQRLAFALGDADGAFLDTGPSELTFRVTTEKGARVGPPAVVPLHHQDLQVGYYPLTFTPPAPGIYVANSATGGQRLTATFQVFNKNQVPLLGAGDRMPSLATPTVANHLGVDPICTRSPACSLHQLSLDAALTQHRPLAFLVATPAYCQTGICGPVLDVLLKHTAAYAGRISFIHNEVYRSGSEAARGIRGPSNLTAAVAALHLSFEPSLVLVKPDGTIFRRVDNIYDGAELTDNLDALLRA